MEHIGLHLVAKHKCHSWFPTDAVVIFVPSAHVVEVANICAPICAHMGVLVLKIGVHCDATLLS